MATLDQIAERAGCSSVTVANVLKGRNKDIWPSTVERANRIRAIANELGYRPNSAAKAVATGRFNAIGLMRSQYAERCQIALATLDAINDELEKLGQHLTLSRVPDDSLEDDCALPRLLREWSIDGLIVTYVKQIPSKVVEAIEGHRTPSVWLNVDQPYDAVRPDDYQGAVLATKHLLGLGHTRIGYVTDSDQSDPHFSVAARRRGYEDTMRSAGLQPVVHAYEPASLQSTWQEQAVNWLRSPNIATAYLCYSARHVTPVQFAASVCGLRVPDQLSVMTLHEDPLVWSGVQVTAACIPAALMGVCAVQMLMEKIQHPGLRIPSKVLEISMVEGQTCAPPQVHQ